ncbi:hypothetical protein DIE11_00465 [Burkholderia sp. Bp9012]|nr:hypothetical protein DIE11_00465 [Burkholderia sp. Bp9012]
MSNCAEQRMNGTRVGSAFGANRASHANDAIDVIVRRENDDEEGRDWARRPGRAAVRVVGVTMR